MSKVGKKPITIPNDVTVTATDGFLEIKGKNGALKIAVLPYVTATINGNELAFTITSDEIQAKANWGTMRALAQNTIQGVSQGFSKVLEIIGIGFRANMEGDELVLSVGFSHPVRFKTPTGVKISVEKSNVTISGPDKYLVGETAAKIRAIRKPEPYKGTGIKYKTEVIRRKAGKKVAGATAAA